MTIMKTLICFLFLSVASYAQSPTDLRGQLGTPMAVFNILGNVFQYDETSTSVDNGTTVIQPTGVATGRWLLQRNLNIRTGNYTTSGLNLTTSYTVTHG